MEHRWKTLTIPCLYAYLPAACPYVEGYTFVQGKDAPGKDIKQITGGLAAAAAACSADPKCKMFNDGGWLKNVDLNLATSSGNTNACSGLYLKRG